MKTLLITILPALIGTTYAAAPSVPLAHTGAPTPVASAGTLQVIDPHAACQQQLETLAKANAALTSENQELTCRLMSAVDDLKAIRTAFMALKTGSSAVEDTIPSMIAGTAPAGLSIDYDSSSIPDTRAATPLNNLDGLIARLSIMPTARRKTAGTAPASLSATATEPASTTTAAAAPIASSSASAVISATATSSRLAAKTGPATSQ